MGTDKPTPAEATALIENEPALLGFEPNILCAWWDTTGDVPAEHNRPVEVDVPILATVGERDPCCGRRWGEELRRINPQTQLVEFAGRGHNTSGPCRTAVISSFLEDPERSVKADCAGQRE